MFDNIGIKHAVRKQQSALNEMWVAMNGLKTFAINSTGDLGKRIDGETAAVDALVDALERFDERMAQLEPKVEEENS